TLIALTCLLAMVWVNGEVKPTTNLFLALLLMPAAGSGLLGGFLMTMLLGHAYLTAGGEMTQKPFMRLVVMLLVLLGLRLIGSAAFGLWPWWASEAAGRPMERVWTVTMITARYAVGLVVPLVLTWMTLDCVKRRANQSATGILYVTTVLVIVGEGIALALMG